jgi:hypothetical protein
MDIRELVRHLRSNPRDRAVARETGVDRRTVKQYRQWAEAQGLLSGPLPAAEDWREWQKFVLAVRSQVGHPEFLE